MRGRVIRRRFQPGRCDCRITKTANDALRARCAPFILPYLSTHSLNDYAGINGRDSELLRHALPPDLQEGITSEDARVEVWPFQLMLQAIPVSGEVAIGADTFEAAARAAEIWQNSTATSPALRAVQDAFVTAPTIPDYGQSLLHIWTAIESLFPSVQTEVTFRLSLYLTQLAATQSDRRAYFARVKKAYAVRSRVAHGGKRAVTADEWRQAWDMLCAACWSVLRRGNLPTEDALMDELLLSATLRQDQREPPAS